MKFLYVIGNGFDKHHGIPCGYNDYLKWLRNDPEGKATLEKMVELYGDDVEKGEWWNDFENNLGFLYDLRGKIEDYGWRNQPSDDDLEKMRAIDTMGGAWDAQEELGGLMESIKNTFHRWVDSLTKFNSALAIKIRREDSFFISFNYTPTLEDLYGIKNTGGVEIDKVLHIHGWIGDDEYVIGHGRPDKEIEEDAEPYQAPWDGKTDPSEYGLDVMDDEITNNAKDAAVGEVTGIRKPVEKIIKQNQKYFDSLNEVEKVFVYGFSFSHIDIPYIDKIIASVREDAEYEISYYTKRDYCTIKSFVERRGLKYKLVKLEDLQKCCHLRLW